MQSVGGSYLHCGDDGAPERIRTSDPQIRSLVLYPAELRVRARGRPIGGEVRLGNPFFRHLAHHGHRPTGLPAPDVSANAFHTKVHWREPMRLPPRLPARPPMIPIGYGGRAGRRGGRYERSSTSLSISDDQAPLSWLGSNERAFRENCDRTDRTGAIGYLPVFSVPR